MWPSLDLIRTNSAVSAHNFQGFQFIIKYDINTYPELYIFWSIFIILPPKFFLLLNINFVFDYFQVLKLHTRLGKPIPSSNPVVLTTKTTTTGTVAGLKSTKGVTKTTTTTTTVTKKIVPPKINFIGGSKLASTSTAVKEEKAKTTTETEIIETEGMSLKFTF